MINEVSPSDLLEIGAITPEKFAEINAVNSWISKYNVFMKAKNLGINFGPKDLDIEEINVFSIIHEAVEKSPKEKGKKHGNKPLKNNI